MELLALDVDGTLVRPDQRVEADVVEAIAEAADAGVAVCLATGRSLVETLPAWKQLRLPADREPHPIVVIGGALVSQPHTGRTLYQRTLPADLANELADELARAGHSALAIVDEWRWGVDYLVRRAEDYDTAAGVWFSQMPDIRIREVDRFDPEGPDVLRINAIVQPEDGPALEDHVRSAMGERLNLHHILAPNYGVTVLECFAADTCKWTAIRYIASGLGIATSRIATVGDDVNDLSMLRGAGVGIAMAHGSESAKQAADRVAENGLAAEIRSLLA